MMKIFFKILFSLSISLFFGQTIAGEEIKINSITKITPLKKSLIEFPYTLSHERVYELSYAQIIKDNNPYLKTIMAVYKRAGLKAKLSPRPTLRALSIADRGIADAEVGHTEEIMKNYPNLIKVDAQLFTFFGRAYALKPEIQSFKKEDLKKYRTGVKRGSYWDQEFIKGIPVTKVESCNQLFDILMAGRIDIGLCPDGVFNNQSNEQREKHKNIRAIGPPIVALPMYHYVHKKNKHLIPLLEKTIREMVTDGSIDPTRSWLK